MFRTGLLLAAMTALFLAIGYMLGGEQGMGIAFLFALATNFFSYWFSDKIVLAMYRAQPIDRNAQPALYAMIETLAINAGIPTPKAYLIDTPQPNAFATGRNPANGAVAVTTGLLQLLDKREIAAVIAHELGHIRNHDTLIMTVTATIAGAIGMLANMALFFGGRRDAEGRGNGAVMFALALLAPLAATLVQMAISRAREYEADAAGADISQDPAALASALRKISGKAQALPNPHAEENPATAHLFIMNPLHGGSLLSLFATHPPAERRIALLEERAAMGNILNTPARYASTTDEKPVRYGSFTRSLRKGPWNQ